MERSSPVNERIIFGEPPDFLLTWKSSQFVIAEPMQLQYLADRVGSLVDVVEILAHERNGDGDGRYLRKGQNAAHAMQKLLELRKL